MKEHQLLAALAALCSDRTGDGYTTSAAIEQLTGIEPSDAQIDRMVNEGRIARSGPNDRIAPTARGLYVLWSR